MLCHHISLNLCSGTHQCQRWSHLQGCWLAQLFLKLGKLLFTRATIDSLNKLWDVGGDSETSIGFTSDVIIMPSFSPLIPLLLPLSLPSLQFSLLLSIAASHHCQIYINLFVTLCSSVSPIALIPPSSATLLLPPFRTSIASLTNGQSIGTGRTIEWKVWSERKNDQESSTEKRREEITPPWKTSRHGNTVATRDGLAC